MSNPRNPCDVIPHTNVYNQVIYAPRRLINVGGVCYASLYSALQRARGTERVLRMSKADT